MFEDVYENESDIPSAVRHLFHSVDGKFKLLTIAEIKTVADVSKLQDSLRKEREDHKATKTNLSAFNGLDSAETLKKLDRYDELEALNNGKADDEKIAELVEKRLTAKTAPLNREIDTLKKAAVENENAITGYKEKDTRRFIHDDLRKAATDSKIRDTAVQDVLIIGERMLEINENGDVVTRDNVGVTPGISAAVWLTECRESRQHWWPESKGGGSRSGGGGDSSNNPFTSKNWNMTEQMQAVKDDPDKAAQLAKSAGTTVGGLRPSA